MGLLRFAECFCSIYAVIAVRAFDFMQSCATAD